MATVTALRRINLRVILSSPEAKKIITIFNIIEKKAHRATKFSQRGVGVVSFNDIFVPNLVVPSG